MFTGREDKDNGGWKIHIRSLVPVPLTLLAARRDATLSPFCLSQAWF